MPSSGSYNELMMMIDLFKNSHLVIRHLVVGCLVFMFDVVCNKEYCIGINVDDKDHKLKNKMKGRTVVGLINTPYSRSKTDYPRPYIDIFAHIIDGY